MFNTIRSKILVIVSVILSLLLLILAVLSWFYYQKSKKILLNSYSHSISVFMQNINKEVIGIEDSALDLAVFGSVYYKSQKKREFLEKFVIEMFENYEESLGGGIWYEPYAIDKNKKRYAVYAYRNKDNIVVKDDNFENENYNYLEQSWYKEIKAQLLEGNKVAWSLPYHEQQGSEKLMVTAGSGIYNNGKFVGLSTVDWEISSILKSVLDVQPTPNSFSLFADKKNDYILISTDEYLNNDELVGKPLKNIPWYNDNLKQRTYFSYQNKKYVPYVKNLDNEMFLIINIPKWELFGHIVANVLTVFLILIAFSLFLGTLLYISLKKNIITPIRKLANIARKIGAGDLSAKLQIEKPYEFAQLASTFDKMTSDIKTITRKQVRLDSELLIAKSIQSSSLPGVFPPFPERHEFDIFASMTPAKEVGGDFYDFYFTGPETFMFLIADVSGKGVPAALFMMRVKTLIANMAQATLPPKELFDAINKEICSNNKEGLFVTVFACIVNIYTGEASFINCGHNPPLIKRDNGNYAYLNINSNIVLGAFSKSHFDVYETILKPGDRIFLYTDGVTEAINKNNEMYGESRLRMNINNLKNDNIENVVNKIKSSVEEYSDLEQTDDVTMLLFQYNGNIMTYKKEAVQENYKEFYTWIHKNCELLNLNADISQKIDMSSEEIYANIMFYAYPEKTGYIEVNMQKIENEVILKFIDEGQEYNPLEKDDPDITLSAEERTPGGLGIFMVKQMSKEMLYERKDGKNILTVKFEI